MYLGGLFASFFKFFPAASKKDACIFWGRVRYFRYLLLLLYLKK